MKGCRKKWRAGAELSAYHFRAPLGLIHDSGSAPAEVAVIQLPTGW